MSQPGEFMSCLQRVSLLVLALRIPHPGSLCETALYGVEHASTVRRTAPQRLTVSLPESCR